MKNDLTKIIQFYGVSNQLKKLSEEVFELQEAITTHELKKSVEYEIPLTEIIGTHEHIIEEIADVKVMLYQFLFYYEIDNDEVVKIMEQKIKRQLDRIDKEVSK